MAKGKSDGLILIWIPGLSFERGPGGSQVQTLRLAGGLISRGFRVVVLAGRPFWGMARRESIVVNGVRVPVAWMPSPSIWLLGSALCIAHVAAYVMLRLQDVDVVHLGSINRVAAVLSIIAKCCGKRVVCRTIGGDIAVLTKLMDQRYIPTKVHVAILKLVDCIAAQSPESEEALVRLGIAPARVALISNGVDTSYYRPYPGDRSELRSSLELPASGKAICCVNRLHPLKRVDVVLRAFHRVLAEQPGCRLLVIGDGPEYERLKQLAASLGVNRAVRFLGFVRDPLPYLQASDVFVLASDVENLSNALMEAMACGLPVVATEVGGNKECVRHGEDGLLVPRASPEAMARALLQLCNDAELALRLGARARQSAVARYSLQATVDQYLQVYGLASCTK